MQQIVRTIVKPLLDERRDLPADEKRDGKFIQIVAEGELFACAVKEPVLVFKGVQNKFELVCADADVHAPQCGADCVAAPFVFYGMVRK